MKYLAFLILTVLCAIGLQAKESVQIGKNIYYLAYEADAKEGSLKEFTPEGETVENWTSLVAVRHFQNVRSPKEYIQNMARQYHEKMPHMQFAVFEKKETKEWVIDFIMYPRDGASGFVEWNYFQAGKPKGTKGIVVNQFVSRKATGATLEEVFKAWDLGSYRKEMLGILMTSKFEVVDD